MKTRATTLVVALGLCSLVLASCGARWTDDQRDIVAARDQQDSTNQRAASTQSASAATTVPQQPAATTLPAARDGSSPRATSSSSGGNASEVDEGSSGPSAASTGAAPCSAPSDAPGVTDDAIEVLSISALSGPVPGLGASAAAATRSYVGYLNANGGVCGRQIILREADDGTDVGRYRSIVQENEPRVFGIAAGFTAADVGGFEVLRDTGIPLVTVVSSDDLTALPNVYDTNPPYESLADSNGKYRYLFEQGARKVAFVYIAVDQSRGVVATERGLLEAAGLEVVLVQEAPLTTLNWDSAARAVANSGADTMIFIADTGADASMARSMAGVDHDVRFADYYTLAYETTFIEQAGTAAEGTMTWLRTLPNTDAASNEQVASFLEWMDQVAPGEVKDQFAADGWTSAKSFFDILARIPGPISRQAFLEAADSIGEYDAGGMLGTIRLGQELNGGCTVGMKVESGRWVRLAPADGFLC